MSISYKCQKCGNELDINEKKRFCRICGAEIIRTEAVLELPKIVPLAVEQPVQIVEKDRDITAPMAKPEEIRSDQVFEIAPIITKPAYVVEPLTKDYLLQGRYRIDEFSSKLSTPNYNFYTFTDLLYYTHCAYCSCNTNQEGDVYCIECGARLDNGIKLWGREEPALGKLTGEALLVRIGLCKPDGLVPEYIVIVENDRVYVLYLQFNDGIPLNEIEYLPLQTRLGWTKQLIDFLIILNQSGFTGFDFDPALLRVLPGERLNLLGGLKTRVSVTPEEQVQDAQMLLKTLQFLMNFTTKAAIEEDITPESMEQERRWKELISTATDIKDCTGLLAMWERIFPNSVSQPLTKLTSAAGWDKGKIRDNNEDAVLRLEYVRQSEVNGGPAGLFAVADGMGGYEKGEEASSIALDTLVEFLTLLIFDPRFSQNGNALMEIQDDQIMQQISRAIQEINNRICTKAAGAPMGSTITMSLVLCNAAYIANVGDSRTYLFRKGILAQITTDDSLVYQMVANGQITREDIYTHPQRNVLMTSLGDKSLNSIDVSKHFLEPGDRLIHCSDGLWEMIRDNEITNILSSSDSPTVACNRLVEAANRNGGEDNIGVVVVDFV